MVKSTFLKNKNAEDRKIKNMRLLENVNLSKNKLLYTYWHLVLRPDQCVCSSMHSTLCASV